MAYKIVVDIVDPGDEEIKVTHTFWGHSEKEARTNYTHHLAACDYFQSAAEEGRLIEEEFEIDEEEVPEVETEEEEEEEEEEEACSKCGQYPCVCQA